MNTINQLILKGFIISVFFFYYEMRFFPLTLHSIFLILGLLSMIISFAIKTIENGLLSIKVPFDIILIFAFAIVIIIGFIQNLSTVTFSNLQAYILGLVCYLFVRNNGNLISSDWVFKVIRWFLIINSFLIITQFTTGRGFVASFFAVGDPAFIIPSGVSDGPTKNGMLQAFAMSAVLGRLFFSNEKFFVIDLLTILVAVPSLIFSASRAGMLSFGVTFMIGLLILFFHHNKNLIRNRKGIFSFFAFISIGVLIIVNLGIINLLDKDPGELKQASDIIIFKLTARSDDSFSDRIENIGKVENIAMASLSKVVTFGIGVGSFEVMNGGFNIHNSYLEVLLQTGLFGFFLFLVLVVYVFYKIVTSDNLTMIIPFFLGLLSTMIFMTSHDILRGRIFWLPLALLMAHSIYPQRVPISDSKNRQ